MLYSMLCLTLPVTSSLFYHLLEKCARDDGRGGSGSRAVAGALLEEVLQLGIIYAETWDWAWKSHSFCQGSWGKLPLKLFFCLSSIAQIPFVSHALNELLRVSNSSFQRNVAGGKAKSNIFLVRCDVMWFEKMLFHRVGLVTFLQKEIQLSHVK